MYPIHWLGLIGGVGVSFGLAWSIRVTMLNARRRLALARLQRVDDLDRLSVEIHDDVIQSMQAVLLQLHVAGKRMALDDAGRGLFDAALDYAEQALAQARDRCEPFRPTLESSWDLPSAFVQLVKQWPGRPRAAFRLIVEGRERDLKPLIREEIYRIGADALAHYLANDTARSVEVDIILGYSHLHVRFRDDCARITHGGGPEPARSRPPVSMHARGHRIGAIVRLWKSPGAGHEVDLDLPATLAYVDDVNDSSRWLRFIFGEGRCRDER